MACDLSENFQVLREAYVSITEQPAPIVKFRYESEERNASLLHGASSTTDMKTFPSIQVVGFKGRAAVLVSLVTAEEPYRPHPHSLVGIDCCSAGVCFLQLSPETMSIQFRSLKIQCVKKNEINKVLKLRKTRNIDPFKTGFCYPSPIDTTTVRLCFQVFLEGNEKGKCNIPLVPVVSEPIVDKRFKPDLVIVELSDCVSRADGGNKKIILLCEKIAKDDDIEVRFYEEKNGEVIWEGFGDFQPSRVHKHVAISFHPPRYHNLEISDPVNVLVQMRRPSDGSTSSSLPFQFLPALDRKRKRQKLTSFMDLSKQLEMKNSPTSEYPEYKINRTSHSTRYIEEDIKGVLAFSRVPDPQGIISSLETYENENIHQNAQEECITQLTQDTSQNATSTSAVLATSVSLSQNTSHNTVPTKQLTQNFPKNTPYILTEIGQMKPQITTTTNILQNTPPILLNTNESQNVYPIGFTQNEPPKINQDIGSDIQSIPSNLYQLIQPSFSNFLNSQTAISQITQAILQNIPSFINQYTQSSIQNTTAVGCLQNSIGTHTIQTCLDAKPSTDITQNTSPTINLVGQSNLQNSPFFINEPIQFIFHNTTPTSNPQNVPTTVNQPIPTTAESKITASNIEMQDRLNWNIPLASQKEGCDQSTNSKKADSNKLKIILDGIRNSEFEPIKLNSGELGSFEGSMNLSNLSEVLSINLSLTDIDERTDQNMSDSLTRLVNSTADNLYQETNTFW